MIDLNSVYQYLLSQQQDESVKERLVWLSEGVNEEVSDEIQGLIDTIQVFNSLPSDEKKLQLNVVRVCCLNLISSFEYVVEEIDKLE